MFTTPQYKPLQDPRLHVPLPDMVPVDPEVKRDSVLPAMVPGQLYGRYQKSEMFPLPRSLWSPLSKAGTGAGRSVATSREADSKDSLFKSPEAALDPEKVPTPINNASGTAIPPSILFHSELGGIRERSTATSPGIVAEALSSAYQYQNRSVSTDSFPSLKQTTSIRTALRNAPELSSRGNFQHGSTPDHFMPPKVPTGSSSTPPNGHQMALMQQYMPTRQYTSRSWSTPPTGQNNGIELDTLYQVTISKYFERIQVSPSKLKNNFATGNRSSAFSPNGFFPFSSNKPWAFSMFGRASAFLAFSPLKANVSVPLGGPTIETFTHPRHRTYFHQFLRKSVLKSIEGPSGIRETACEIGKDGTKLEEDIDSGDKVAGFEENIQIDALNRPISAHYKRGSAIATHTMEESNTAELRKAMEMLTPIFHESDNRVTELDQETEDDVSKAAPSTHRRKNSLRYTVLQRASVFNSTSVGSDFAFIVEGTTSQQLKRKHNPKEENTEKAQRKRIRDNSVESNISSPTNSIASRLSILIDTPERRQANLNSPGRELILSPINTQCAQITECLITEPLLSNSIPDSPVTPTSTTDSAARWSTHSMISNGTGITDPFSYGSPSASHKLLTEKAWEEEELRGRRRTQVEGRFLSIPGSSSSRRGHSTGAIISDRPVERTHRRSLSTSSILANPTPIFQQSSAASSTYGSQNLDIEPVSDYSESGSIVEPKELEDPFIFSPSPSVPAQNTQGNLFVPQETKKEQKKDAVKGFRRISHLGQHKPIKSFTAKVTEPPIVGETEDIANKKKKFQKLKDRVKGLSRKVSGAIKKEKY